MWSKSILILSPGAGSPSRNCLVAHRSVCSMKGRSVEARANLASARAAISEMDARLAAEREQLLKLPNAQLGPGRRSDLERALSLAGVGHFDRQAG
jgi:hypothetical protein